ncbi:MAG: 50S ribosomal protein L31e [Candidatus Nanoarchaeia archaeon]
MAEVERVYNIPLRQKYLKSPKWRRSKKAIFVIREFIQRHAKVKKVKLSRWVNEYIWRRGSKHPPSKLSVKVKIDKEKGIAQVELSELPKKALKTEKAKEKELKKKSTEKKEITKKEDAQEQNKDKKEQKVKIEKSDLLENLEKK